MMINKNRIKNHLLMVMVLALASAYGCKKDSPDLKSISLDKTTLSLYYDEDYSFTVSYFPADLKTPEYKWTSSNEKVATVDNAGKVNAVSVGETTITVKTTDNRLASECEVTVMPYSNLCKEPITEFGTSRSNIKNKETRTLCDETDETLLYYGENEKLRYCGYIIEAGKMTYGYLFLENSVPTYTEASTFLAERYTYLGESEGILCYTNKIICVGLTYDDTLGYIAVYFPYTTSKQSDVKSVCNVLSAKKAELTAAWRRATGLKPEERKKL